jgi:hypothetical protein
MGSNRRQQTINKRNRERAVAEKRALKIQRRQEKREAARDGEETPLEQAPLEQDGDAASLEQDGSAASLEQDDDAAR